MGEVMTEWGVQVWNKRGDWTLGRVRGGLAEFLEAVHRVEALEEVARVNPAELGVSLLRALSVSAWEAGVYEWLAG